VSSDKRSEVPWQKRPATAPTALNSADPARNFTLTMDQRVRAITIGVPAWAERKRTIEDTEERLVGKLLALHDKLAERGRSASEIERELARAAADFDLSRLNGLVAKHNRWYPVEANLPMNRDGDYLVYGRVWEREEPYTAGRLLALTAAALARR
jgi:hypothetical protein